MRATLIATALALCSMLITPVVAQMPTAGPEHKRLNYFAGTWNFTGQAMSSPMGPGGPISFKETCELMDGGFALVCRSEGKGPMGPTKAVALMGYDAAKKAYTYTAAESNMPMVHATGTTQGPAWIWTTEADMMTMKVTVTEDGPKGYDFKMEMTANGKTMEVMHGRATKVTS